jgi:nicotinamidase/pyrazinamidase
MGKLFLGVDWQYGFITGQLAVPGAEEAGHAAANYFNENSKKYDAVAFSFDFHSRDHCSFEENGGPWKNHCMAHTIDAALFNDFVEPLKNFIGDVMFITKGEDPNREEYSLFRNEAGEEQFGYLVRTNNITEVDVCGLVREICVQNTIQDLHERFPDIKVNVLLEFTPSLDDGSAFAEWLKENSWCNVIES